MGCNLRKGRQNNFGEFNLARFRLDYYLIISCSYSIILFSVIVKMKVIKKTAWEQILAMQCPADIVEIPQY